MGADTTTIVVFCHITIPAKYLKIRGESELNNDSSPICVLEPLPILLAVILDMVKGKEGRAGFPTTYTFSAVVLQYLKANACIVFLNPFPPSLAVLRFVYPTLMPSHALSTF